MIDNFELIKSLFYFNEANDMFFHCQIVQRAKDHPNEKVKEGAIHTYFIRSKEHLERLMPEIKLLCNFYGARAYINTAGKDFSKVNKLILVKIATYINEGNTVNPRKIFNSAAGETKSRYPVWIVDIDTKDKEPQDKIFNWLKDYFEKTDEKKSWFRALVPTVQGCHFIVRPFNLLEFNKEFPDIIVHKNSMGTLLYMPELKQD